VRLVQGPLAGPVEHCPEAFFGRRGLGPLRHLCQCVGDIRPARLDEGYQALSELRALVRGIHPPVLAERGLDGAVRALAFSLPLPVDLHIDLPGRPSAPVESAAYFAIAEALANVMKHSGANRAWVQLEYDHRRLVAIVGDNGAGGAQPRAAAVDSGPGLLHALVTHRPDVAVVDVRLPPTFTDEGLRAAIQARAQVPGLPVLVLSQHVEQLYAKELLAAGTGGLGYLLKDRVSDVRRFIEAVRTVAGGGTAMDPDVVSQLLARHDRDDQLGRLTSREREVLALMAEGHSNAGIASRLVVTEKAVSKHIGNIFAKLGLYPAEDGNRRVLAVLTYLNA
jgi:DNA-binding NarL/FixJ family response regulator